MDIIRISVCNSVYLSIYTILLRKITEARVIIMLREEIAIFPLRKREV